MLAIYYFCSYWLGLLSAHCDSADAEQNIFLLLAYLKMLKGFVVKQSKEMQLNQERQANKAKTKLLKINCGMVTFYKRSFGS